VARPPDPKIDAALPQMNLTAAGIATCATIGHFLRRFRRFAM
jgi:hypothetical protein